MSYSRPDDSGYQLSTIARGRFLPCFALTSLSSPLSPDPTWTSFLSSASALTPLTSFTAIVFLPVSFGSVSVLSVSYEHCLATLYKKYTMPTHHGIAHGTRHRAYREARMPSLGSSKRRCSGTWSSTYVSPYTGISNSSSINCECGGRDMAGIELVNVVGLDEALAKCLSADA